MAIQELLKNKEQTDNYLLTMYDLPSEDPEEPGVPDLFHIWQPDLLSKTFCPPDYKPEQMVIAADLNLYYDVDHPLWHKRPDWFAALGVPYLYNDWDIRLSYVVWQEKVIPSIVVELLSPGTEKEDMGKTSRKQGEPPSKWEVYEQILGIPWYVLFNRHTNKFRIFKLVRQPGGSRKYFEIALSGKRIWLPDLKIGLGLWKGKYGIVESSWLRWFDKQGNPIPTPEEQERQRAEQERQRASNAEIRAEQEKQRASNAETRAEQERQRAEQERQRALNAETRAEMLAAKLKELGIEV